MDPALGIAATAFAPNLTATMLRAETPAPLERVLDLYSRSGFIKPMDFKAAVVQAARSESVGWYDGDRLVAAAMFYPLPCETAGEQLRELAFVCVPDFARYLVAFIHHSRLTRVTLAKNGPVRIRALVRAGYEPGRRLARLVGLTPVGLAGAFERYEFEGRPDVKICGRDQIPL